MSLPTGAPLHAEALDLALQPFGRSRMLPAAAYVSTEVFGWEQRHFFAAGWTCVGRRAELSDGHRAISAGDVGVLLTRDGDGALRAFANVCRHRGHEPLPVGGVGRHRSLVCPYHGWSYRPDGSLLAAPGFTGLTGTDAGELGLVPLRVVEWHGWVFVSGSTEPGDFAEQVAGLDDVVAPYRPETLVPGAEHVYEVAANWKVLQENFHECYHCSLIHPELCRVSPPESGRNFRAAGTWVGGVMDLLDGAETMSLDGQSAGRRIEGLPAAQRRSVTYLGLFPDLLLSLHPDYVMAHRLQPLAAGTTRVTCSWYFPAEATARPGFDPAYAVDFWDRTNRQDWEACESVQRGLGSPHYRPGPLSPREDAVYAFVTMVARGYRTGRVRPAHLTG